MGKYENKNAQNILNNVNACIAELSNIPNSYNYDYDSSYDWGRVTYSSRGYRFRMRSVCNELSIFDWWKDTLSLSQLKQMKTFLENAIKLGFNGYVCFKVGASGCSHGMWAHKMESENGYSPDGDTLFHSFRSGDNYYGLCINGEWLKGDLSLRGVKDALCG